MLNTAQQQASFFPVAMKPGLDPRPESRNEPPSDAPSIQTLQMQELHHRMRNSLHLIACTLQLQSRQADHAQTREALDTAARRIDSVARIHEHLYASSALGGQPARDYLASLLRDLHAALLGPDSTRRLELTSGPAFTLDSDMLVSLGSVVAELVTNAVKYSPGHVRVTLTACADRTEILVEDEGRGFPAGFDPVRDAGFGLRLIHRLSAASGGALTVDTQAGHGSVRVALVG